MHLKSGWSALMWASKTQGRQKKSTPPEDRWKVVEYLLNAEADVNLEADVSSIILTTWV